MKTIKARLFLIAVSIFVGATISGCEDVFEPTQPGLLVPRTVDEDLSLPQLLINDTKLHAEVYGDPGDPMMVILHGGPGGDYRSMINCREFSNHGYFVVFYDQRGSGLSQRHPRSEYSLKLMIEDLDAIIQHYRHSPDQKIFLVGHSWGAMLATAYIDRYPFSITGAVLAEPGGFTWSDTQDYLSRSHQWKPFSEQVNDAFYFDQIITGKEHETLDYKFALTSAVDNGKGNAVGNAGPTPFWRYGAVVQTSLFEIADEDGFDFTKNLHQFTSKVLFLYSELNSAYGLNHAQLVSSAYPNVQLTLIPGTGHEIPYFGWENFFSTVLEYLNELNRK